MVAAITGLSEKTLKRYALPYLVSYTHSPSHASYYPGAATLSIKLIFQPGTGRILGSQIVGGEGVDKRIDVLATAISGGMTVRDLEDLELAYAPPFGSAKDPVNIAGYVASNMLKGDVENIYPPQLAEINPAGEVLIDLRNRDELDTVGRIPGSLHIPLPELRNSLAGLDRQKTYLPFCAAGLRGYLGHRILIQRGFISKNLSGGFKTYSSTKEKLKEEV
jgi:rhodanese-related sulfurtransferase